jgi:hypothetical protein
MRSLPKEGRNVTDTALRRERQHNSAAVTETALQQESIVRKSENVE